jgi:hypothetical protein
MGKRNRRVTHRISRKPPASGRRLRHRLTNQNVATGAAELLAFSQQFQDLFQRREQRESALKNPNAVEVGRSGAEIAFG